MSGGVITVEDQYGDGVFWQNIESCDKCGALLFRDANFSLGGTLDTRAQHRAWHEEQA